MTLTKAAEIVEKIKDIVARQILTWSSLGLFGLMLYGLCRSIKTSEHGWGSGDAAAWMQAIGVVLTIYVVIFIEVVKTDREEKKNRETQAALAKGVWDVVKLADSLVKRIDGGKPWQTVQSISIPSKQRETFIALIVREASEIHSILAGFDVNRLSATNLIDVVLQARLAMSDLIQAAAFFSVDESNGKLKEASNVQMQHVRNRVALAIKDFPKM